MYYNITKSLFKEHSKKILIPYLNSFLLFLLFIVFFSLEKSFETKISRETPYKESIINIYGDTSNIKEFNLFYRLEEIFVNDIVIPYVVKKITIENLEVEIIGTKEDFLTYQNNIESTKSGLNVISGNSLISSNKVAINLSMKNEIIDEDSILIHGNQLDITTILDDYSQTPRIYMSYILYDEIISTIHKELSSGFLVYHFDQLQIILKDKVTKNDLIRVKTLMGDDYEEYFKIVTKERLVKEQLNSLGFDNDQNKILFQFYLFTYIIILIQIIMFSFKRRYKEFSVYQLLGVSFNKILLLSLIENIFASLIVLCFSVLSGIILTSILSIILNIPFRLISFIRLFNIGSFVMLFTFVVNIVIGVLLLKRKKLLLVRRIKK